MITIISGKAKGQKVDFFTSDQHIGHANIARLANRPFNNDYSTDKMDNTIIDLWNSVASQGDTVLVLGDVALGSIEVSLNKWKRMLGRKLLIPGNHDRVSSLESQSRQSRFRPMYEDAGFTILDEIVELESNGTKFLASHYPYFGDSQGSDRFKNMRPQDNGLPLVHGHTHSSEAFRSNDRKHFHVGVDAHNFRPVSAQTIEQWLR